MWLNPEICSPAATLLSLLARYLITTPPLHHVVRICTDSIFRTSLHAFQRFLALLLYVLRFEWLPTSDSALPIGVVRGDGTMVSADSLQTDDSAVLSRLSRVSQDKICNFASPPPHGGSPSGQTLRVWLASLTAVGSLPSNLPCSLLTEYRA